MTIKDASKISSFMLRNYRARPRSGRWSLMDTSAETMEYGNEKHTWIAKVEFGKLYVYKLKHSYKMEIL